MDDSMKKNEREFLIDLYLDIMKKCLTRTIGKECYTLVAATPEDGDLYRIIEHFKAQNALLVRKIDHAVRREGVEWPMDAETMVGMKRLDNIQFCVTEVIRNGVPGDLIETGVWRGGASIFMRSILKAHGVTDRTVWVADSFQGLPKADEEKYPDDAGSSLWVFDDLRVSAAAVRGNFERYGLLDDQVRFLEGWFKDTLPSAPIEKLAVARLDGDMYGSTMDALTALYPRVSPGGFVIIDDFALPPCMKAVYDYRAANGVTDRILVIDSFAAYWQKTGE